MSPFLSCIHSMFIWLTNIVPRQIPTAITQVEFADDRKHAARNEYYFVTLFDIDWINATYILKWCVCVCVCVLQYIDLLFVPNIFCPSIYIYYFICAHFFHGSPNSLFNLFLKFSFSHPNCFIRCQIRNLKKKNKKISKPELWEIIRQLSWIWALDRYTSDHIYLSSTHEMYFEVFRDRIIVCVAGSRRLPIYPSHIF